MQLLDELKICHILEYILYLLPICQLPFDAFAGHFFVNQNYTSMKKILTVAAWALFAACNTNTPAATTEAVKSNPDSSTMVKAIQSPYPISYSSKFTIDEPKNAETLLAIWKAYDNGDLSTSKEFFADTVEVALGDGSVMHTTRDSMLAGIQTFRNSFKNAFDRVAAVMAVKSTDKNEHWALIWGTEIDTYKNGKIDSTDLQETWRFNKTGKADLVFQYRRPAAPPKPSK